MNNDNNTETFKKGYIVPDIESLGCASMPDMIEITRIVDGEHYIRMGTAKFILDHQQSKIDQLQKTISEQREVISKLVKMGEFYGDEDSWCCHACSADTNFDAIVDSDLSTNDEYNPCGGKLARQTLKEELVSKYIKGN